MSEARKSQAKEIQKKDAANLPANFDLESYAGQGFENASGSDAKLPILKILHTSSPYLDESDPKYVEGAKFGDIFSEASGNLWKGSEGILVVPCFFINTYNEWKDMGEKIGRPAKIHLDPAIMTQTKRDKGGKDRLPNGNYVEDTGNHFVLILDKDLNTVEQALIAMKSTQRKKSRTWITMMNTRRVQGKTKLYNPASWQTVYKLTTSRESNQQYKWAGWNVEFHSYLDAQKNAKLLKTSYDFFNSCAKNDVFGEVEFAEEQKLKKVESTGSTPF